MKKAYSYTKQTLLCLSLAVLASAAFGQDVPVLNAITVENQTSATLRADFECTELKKSIPVQLAKPFSTNIIYLEDLKNECPFIMNDDYRFESFTLFEQDPRYSPHSPQNIGGGGIDLQHGSGVQLKIEASPFFINAIVLDNGAKIRFYQTVQLLN